MALGELTVAGSWLGVLAFTFQIYFDFSGHSDMAIGLGRMLGFEFPPNFNYPLFPKASPSSGGAGTSPLSTWFREYLYIPLGATAAQAPVDVQPAGGVWRPPASGTGQLELPDLQPVFLRPADDREVLPCWTG